MVTLLLIPCDLGCIMKNVKDDTMKLIDHVEVQMTLPVLLLKSFVCQCKNLLSSQLYLVRHDITGICESPPS